MSPILTYAFSASFAVLIACLFVSSVCGIALFFVKWRRVNEAFQHPLLKVKPFKQYPFSLQAAMTLDYFLRMMFPKSVGPGLIGNANRLLKHVDPKKMPFDARWPVAGFWGGCLFGSVAMLAVWVLLIFNS